MSALVLRDRKPSGYQTSSAFLSRRLVRIFPIYWLFALVVVVRKLHSSGSVSVTYLPSFFLVPPVSLHWSTLIGVSWTLDFEMFFYCCIAIFLLFTTRHTLRWLLIGLCILVGIGVLFPPAIGSIQMVYLNPMLLEFVMGILIALIHFKRGPSPRMGLTLLALGLLMTVGLNLFRPHGATGLAMILENRSVFTRVFTWGIAAALLVSGAVFLDPKFNNRIWTVFVVLGNSSYSAYLASSLVIEFVVRGLMASYPKGSIPFWIQMIFQVITVLAVLLAGWLSYQFIEWPMVRSLQGRLIGSKRSIDPAPTCAG